MFDGALEKLAGIELDKMPDRCVACDKHVANSDLYRRLRVCPNCRFHHSISGLRYITAIADSGTFKSSPPLIQQASPVGEHEQTASDISEIEPSDAVITGTCEIAGIKCVIVSLNFSSSGGNIGILVGEKLARSFEWAATHKLPCVTVVTSGGERVEEGVLEMLQMIKTVHSARALMKSSVPYIAVLGHPCTGAAFASFITQADIILSEPKARVGFMSYLSIRQAAEASGQDASLYRSEHVTQWGQIEGVVDREFLKRDLDNLLHSLMGRKQLHLTPAYERSEFERKDQDETEPKQGIATGKRPLAKDYLETMLTDFVPFTHDNLDDTTDAIILGVGQLHNAPVAIIAVNKTTPTTPTFITAAELNRVARLVRLADKFKLPIVTLVDECHPAVGIEYEKDGLARSISDTIATLGEVTTPVIATIIGPVGSEATLALSIADQVAMLSNTVYMLNTRPQRATLIDSTYKTHYFGPTECLDMGIVDCVIEADRDASEIRDSNLPRKVRDYVAYKIDDLQSKRETQLVQSRTKRFRDIDSEYTVSETRMRRRWDIWQAGIKAAAKSIRQPIKQDSEEVEEQH